MAVDEVLVVSGEGHVDVQVGGPGQSAWKFLSPCAGLSGPSMPREGTEVRYCQDPRRSGKFVVSTKIKTPAGLGSLNLTTKLGKTQWLEGLDCPFSLRARFTKCGIPEDPQEFDPIMVTFSDIDINSDDYGDLAVVDGSDEIIITNPCSVADHYWIKKISGSRAGSLADFGDIAINDWAVCDVPQCPGYCGTLRDGCSVYYGVTDLDTTPYGWSSIIQGIKDVIAGTITWDTDPIIGVNGNVEAVECAGSRVIVSSNGASMIAYNETYDDNGFLDQDEWNIVTLTHAPAANKNCLQARTPLEIWVACADGYVAKSVDKGGTFSYVAVGTALNAIWAYDANLVFAVGNNGQMYRSTDGGTTWTDITEVATTAANLLVVRVPPGRSQEVYIGTNSGEIFKSANQGATFANKAFAGDGVGTVDDMAFAGALGDVLWILHNDAGPRGRILRDLSGGNLGADVRVEVGYTAVIAAGVDLNALVACDENTAWAAGEASGGYPAVIKVA